MFVVGTIVFLPTGVMEVRATTRLLYFFVYIIHADTLN